jgi:general secretion pathway protein D
MDYVDAPVGDVVKYMAEITCKNFIIKDDLTGKITIISHQQVSVSEAYEAFLSALEVVGYTTVTVGRNTKIVPTTEAANAPLKIYQTDDELPSTDNFVTQIIQLENVSVTEMASVVKELAGSKVRVVAYAPTNTLIITDSAFNIRRVYKIVSQLDVAAPKSKLVVVPLTYATAADVEKILEEVYGVAATSSSASSSSSANSTR